MRIIAGEARGRRIAAPRGVLTRPATARVRESIFSRLAARWDVEGARVLDLFAGSGSLGIEALSRGAARVVFVDSSRAAASAIAQNLRLLKFEGRASVVIAAAERALLRLGAQGERFDLVFVDAPYRRDTSTEVLRRLADTGVVSAGGWVVVRQAARAPEPPGPSLERVSVATIGGQRITLFRRDLTGQI